MNSISGLLATHPGTAKHIIKVLMPHVPTSCRSSLCFVTQQKSEVSFNKLPRYAAAETGASVRPNTAVQVFILSVPVQ